MPSDLLRPFFSSQVLPPPKPTTTRHYHLHPIAPTTTTTTSTAGVTTVVDAMVVSATAAATTTIQLQTGLLWHLEASSGETHGVHHVLAPQVQGLLSPRPPPMPAQAYQAYQLMTMQAPLHSSPWNSRSINLIGTWILVPRLT
jgi:hypothetical protein